MASVLRAPSVPVVSGPMVPMRKRCKRMTPAERYAFFQPGAEGRLLYGDDAADAQLESLKTAHSRVVNIACSATWMDAWWGDAKFQYPPGGDETAMVPSRVRTSVGYAERQYHRFAPPQNVGEEDYIDELEPLAARRASTSWPASPSARAIQMHAFYKRQIMRRVADDGGRHGNGITTTNVKIWELC